MIKPILEVKNISARVGNGQVLSNVSLTVGKAERLAIIGHNGAGKSTFLKVITGFTPVSEGTIRCFDFAVTDNHSASSLRQFRSQIGMVFQGLFLVGRLTALENVLIARLPYNRSPLTWLRIFPRSERDLARAALNEVGLTHKASQRVDTLSGGERQKVAIARAIAQEASLILADEPTAALDPYAAADVTELLSELADRHKLTLISVLHDISLLPKVSQRVIGFREGRVIFDEKETQLSRDQIATIYGVGEHVHKSSIA